MRILMYSSYFPPQYSGAAKQAIDLARYLRDRGHHIEFVTAQWPGLARFDTVEEFPVERLDVGGRRKHREFRLWWNFLKLVIARRREFDILHSHGAYYTNSIVAPLARMVGWKSLVKASLEANDLFGVRESAAGWIHYLFLRLTDAYVAISENLREEFIASGLPREKIRFLPNAVDTERFRPICPREKTILRKKLGLPEGAVIALSVGVFDQRKNIGWLVEQWVNRSAFGYGAVLVAVGPQSREDADGRFLAYLRGLADANPGIVRLIPQVGNVEEFYRAADLFILPSRVEGLPNVILEAMASGLPCVATDVGGTRELVRDGDTGFLFDVGDHDGLARAVGRCIQEAGGEMGMRGRAFISAGYRLAIRAQEYESLYAELLAGKR